MANRYFIIPLPNEHSSLWNLVVEDESTIRKNLAENKMIVKLFDGDETNHPILNGITEYTHEGILQYLVDNEEDWYIPIPPFI